MQPAEPTQTEGIPVDTPPSPKRSKKKFWLLALGLIILIASGSVAYFLLKKSPSEPAPKSSIPTQDRNTKTQVGKYLNIPELEVKLELPVEIKDAYYVINRHNGEGQNNRISAEISTKEVAQLDSGCSAESYSLASVEYYTDPNEDVGPVEYRAISEDQPDTIKVGEKYIYYTTYRQSPCQKTSGTDQSGFVDPVGAARIEDVRDLLRMALIESSDGTGPGTPAEQDIAEIKKFTESVCKDNGGYGGEEISSDYLKSKSNVNGYHYYGGYALVGISCKSEPGGYMSFIQRQSDGAYKQLIGAQDIPSCTKVIQHKIPHQILPTCISDNSQDGEIPNTN